MFRWTTVDHISDLNPEDVARVRHLDEEVAQTAADEERMTRAAGPRSREDEADDG